MALLLLPCGFSRLIVTSQPFPPSTAFCSLSNWHEKGQSWLAGTQEIDLGGWDGNPRHFTRPRVFGLAQTIISSFLALQTFPPLLIKLNLSMLIPKLLVVLYQAQLHYTRFLVRRWALTRAARFLLWVGKPQLSQTVPHR